MASSLSSDSCDSSQSQLQNQIIDGTLLLYDSVHNLTAFCSNLGSKHGEKLNYLIYIAGLDEGFLASPYLSLLAKSLHSQINVSLIQIILRSSYNGYGISTLSQDVDDLDQFISYFISNHHPLNLSLLGYSTGCQIISTYLKQGKHKDRILSFIFQAPVSDREYAYTLPQTHNLLAQSIELIQNGKETHIIDNNESFQVFNAPITAYRFYSLCSNDGEDDIFSTDLSKSQIIQRIGHLKDYHGLFFISLYDEYVPNMEKYQQFIHQLNTIINVHNLHSIVFLEDNHNINKKANHQILTDSIIKFLNQIH